MPGMHIAAVAAVVYIWLDLRIFPILFII